MKLSALILVSLAANLTLAALLYHASHGATAPSGPAAANRPPSPAQKSAPAASVAAPAETPAAAAFFWRDLPVDDLKEYLRRLRAVNCPETTAQDLILAEVNRRFTAKTRALWQDADWTAQADYWNPYRHKQDPAQAKKNRERFKAQTAAQKEKSALIVELFGFDVEKQRMKEEGYDVDSDNVGWQPAGNLSFLPESKRDAVQKYLEDFSDKEQEFYASIAGGWAGGTRQAKAI